jgi:hypothetical protein
MTALALQHVPRGEVIQLLTERMASARDLPGVGSPGTMERSLAVTGWE